MTEHRGRPWAEQTTEVVSPAGDDRHDHAATGSAAPPHGNHPRYDPTWDDSSEHDSTWDHPSWHDSAGDEHDRDDGTHPDYRDSPVVVRRADDVAGVLLLLAGIAAGVSLLVVWVHGGATGLDLVRAGAGDPQRLGGRDGWESLAVVGGGAVLFVLGLLVLVPARSHRFLGAVALLVTLVVAAGVLVPLADLHWDTRSWAVGSWAAVVVGALGALGAVKALMTHPKRR